MVYGILVLDFETGFKALWYMARDSCLFSQHCDMRRGGT